MHQKLIANSDVVSRSKLGDFNVCFLCGECDECDCEHWVNSDDESLCDVDDDVDNDFDVDVEDDRPLAVRKWHVVVGV